MRDHERGSASFVMAGVLGVVLCVASAGLVLGGYLVAVHRARSAADLAALSGAAAFARGEAACAEAGRSSRANDAELVSCQQVGDQLDFVVSARVRVVVGLRVPGLPRTVEGIAYAGADSQAGG